MRIPDSLRVRQVLIGVVSALLVSACGGGNGSGVAPPPQQPPPPPPPPFGANFSEIQANVFDTTCARSGCHLGAGAPQGLVLDAANSFALLVGVASTEVPSVLRVAPGDPNNSYLIQKLEGTAAVGVQMPFGGTPLDQATIDVIRQWISDGAIDDRTPSTNPIRVTSLAPVPGSTVNTVPAGIVAMFDRELDVSTVNTNTFLVDASGGDGSFGDGNETSLAAAAITTPGTAPMSATFDLTGVAMPDDTYRVRLLGSGASVILDIDANALDGEFSGSFPSGDGTQGGDFEATFELQQVTPVTFDDLQTSIFTPSCAVSGCHTGASPPQGLRLDAGFAFSNLVNVASTEVPSLLRVDPGNPNNSYLVQKLEGTAAVGARMPFGGAPLDQALIDDVREWITNGANP